MPVVISSQTKIVAYGVAALCVLALIIHYGISFPDAIERAREGVRRTREAPCLVLQPSPQNAVLGKLPQRAPDFALSESEGRVVSLSSLRGRVVLVNFWATWCPTCVVEMASLEQLATDMKDRPFSLLAVTADENWDLVRKFFPEGTPLTVLLDKERATPGSYGTTTFPESYLIDPEGNIRYYVISERRIWESKEVKQCIEALLDE